ncbi:MAG: DUF465 domain-containing protein [Proteobacteria bacterium]|nr:DUF465 domain-containing protein [Pseudomonadota bacterium]
MTHVLHDLHAEFPEDGEILHRLKLNDAHFQKVSEAYSTVNHEIHRIEAGIDAASDTRLEDLKKQRLALLDDVATLIARAKEAA